MRSTVSLFALSLVAPVLLGADAPALRGAIAPDRQVIQGSPVRVRPILHGDRIDAQLEFPSQISRDAFLDHWIDVAFPENTDAGQTYFASARDNAAPMICDPLAFRQLGDQLLDQLVSDGFNVALNRCTHETLLIPMRRSQSF